MSSLIHESLRFASVVVGGELALACSYMLHKYIVSKININIKPNLYENEPITTSKCGQLFQDIKNNFFTRYSILTIATIGFVGVSLSVLMPMCHHEDHFCEFRNSFLSFLIPTLVAVASQKIVQIKNYGDLLPTYRPNSESKKGI